MPTVFFHRQTPSGHDEFGHIAQSGKFPKDFGRGKVFLASNPDFPETYFARVLSMVGDGDATFQPVGGGNDPARALLASAIFSFSFMKPYDAAKNKVGPVARNVPRMDDAMARQKARPAVSAVS